MFLVIWLAMTIWVRSKTLAMQAAKFLVGRSNLRLLLQQCHI